jgi:hypothetical protein
VVAHRYTDLVTHLDPDGLAFGFAIVVSDRNAFLVANIYSVVVAHGHAHLVAYRHPNLHANRHTFSDAD